MNRKTKTCNQKKVDNDICDDRCHSTVCLAVPEMGSNEDSLIPADGFLYTDSALSDQFLRERHDSSGSLD